MIAQHFRMARPTDDLDAVPRFYRDGMGMEVIPSFQDHAGFDGVMLGLPGAGYYLEFTHHRGHLVGRASTPDNLLVFYIPDPATWRAVVERMRCHGYLV